jgi:hypothetical protein
VSTAALQVYGRRSRVRASVPGAGGADRRDANSAMVAYRLEFDQPSIGDLQGVRRVRRHAARAMIF